MGFEKCDRTKRSTCKSDEELESWLHRKFMIILENQARFASNAYGVNESNGRIVRESVVTWYPIGTDLDNREEILNNVKVTEVTMQDYRGAHLNELTAHNETIFNTEFAGKRVLAFNNNVHLTVSYEFVQTKYFVK